MIEAGLYIHIPFCVRKCAYCDFLSFSADDSEVSAYFDALYKEIDVKCSNSNLSNYIFTSIFIGGGTPSSVSPEFILKLMDKLKDSVNILPDAEITIESNPGTLDESKLEMYRNAGINRISIGVQSSSDRLLRILGRIHNSNEAYDSVLKAKKYFTNINLDFISGIHGIKGEKPQALNEALDAIDFALALGVTHISNYGLILEEGTKLYDLYKQNSLQMLPDEQEREMYHQIRAKLISNGFVHYEISNFAKAGFESKHNIKYWTGVPCIGLGLGSVSYSIQSGDTFKRYSNTRDFKSYCRGEYSQIIEEELDILARKKEFMMLGFRLVGGPNEARYFDLFGSSMRDDFSKELQNIKKSKFINDDFSLTIRGMDFANEIFEEFI